MHQHNPGMIPNDLIDALRDAEDWKRCGKPSRKVWVTYKVLRDPSSYRLISRHHMVRILEKHGLKDPCPITEAEWARLNPKAAAFMARRRQLRSERWTWLGNDTV